MNKHLQSLFCGRPSITSIAFAFSVGLLFVAFPGFTQDDHPNLERGFAPEKSIFFSEPDSINAFNGGLTLSVPLGFEYPLTDAFSYGFVLSYSSNPWDFVVHRNSGPDPDPDSWLQAHPAFINNAGFGWMLSMGAALRYHSPGNMSSDENVYVSPDGARHSFYETLHLYDDEVDPDNEAYYTRDGSYLRLTWELDPLRYFVEHPDGRRSVFSSHFLPISNTHEWRLDSIEDVFGNYVNIVYSQDCRAGDEGDECFETWGISDSAGRIHTLEFQFADFIEPPGGGEPTLVEGKEIEHLTIASPHGGSSCYQFDYEWVEIPRHEDDDDDETSENVMVRLLDTITYPDSASEIDPCTQYCIDCSYTEFEYHEEGSGDPAGVIASMRLPTGGVIEWDYQLFKFPGGDSYCDEDTTNNPSAYGSAIQDSTGVLTRELIGEPAGSGVWTYTPEAADQLNKFDAAVSRTITDPIGNTTELFFNTLVDRCHESVTTPGGTWPAWHGWDYGLPYDLEASISGLLGDPLYLSKRIYEGSGPGAVLVRSEYVRFEHDKLPEPDAPPWNDDSKYWYDTNRRRVQQRSVFLDDGGRYREEWLSNFDGLGHFRSKSMTGSIDPDGGRSSFVGYNPDNAAGIYRWYGIDSATNDPRPGMNYEPWQIDQPWILGTYDKKHRYRDGEFKLSDYCFDTETGFLDGFRTHFNTTNESRHESDVITLFAPDSLGNVETIQYFGADDNEVPSTGEFSACDPYGDFDDVAEPSYTVHRDHDFGVLSKQFMQDGLVSIYSVDRDIDQNTGLTETERDVSGYSTVYEYDNLGRITDVTPWDGATTEIGYTPATGAGSSTIGAKIRIINRSPSGTELTDGFFRYDPFGRLFKERHQLPSGWNMRQTRYNALGWPLWVTEWQEQTLPPGVPLKKTKFLDYDPFGRARTIQFPDGYEKQSIFEGVRRITEKLELRTAIGDPVSDYSLSEKVSEFGLVGELLKVVQKDDLGSSIVTADYSYDVAGNLSVAALTDGPATQTRLFDYDGLGFLRYLTIPEKDNTVWHSVYDALGNVWRVIEGNRDLEYAYDAFGRISSIKESGGTTDLKTFEYYPITVNPPESGPWGWGKLGRTTRRNPVPNGELMVEHSYSYYETGGAVSHLKTVAGLDGNNGTFEQSYVWDDLGSLSKVRYPNLDGSTSDPLLEVDYTYNRGWLDEIEKSVGGGPLLDVASGFSYHPNGVLAGLTHSNGVTEAFGLDPDYMTRPRSIHVDVNGASNDWSSGYFSYDGAGNITGIGDKSFAYDHASRLTEFLDGPGGTYKTCEIKAELDYDGFGNIFHHIYPMIIPSSEACDPNPHVCLACFTWADPTNNQFEDFAYDAFGNQTQFEYMGATDELQYTVFDELYFLNIGDGPFIYGFDVDGERIGVSDPNLGGQGVWGIRYTIRDLGGRVLREFNLQDTESSMWSWEKDYIWAGSRLIAVEDENGRQHVHPDHLGSTRLVTDSSGNRVSYHEYYPLGMEITPPYQDDVRMKFTGHERDSLADQNSFYDLDYMHARNYSLLFGRFTSLDPAPANPANPQSWHPYAYVLNNPIRYRDPWGLSGDDTSNHGTSGCFAGSAAGDSICVEPEPLTVSETWNEFARVVGGGATEEEVPWPAFVQNAALEGSVTVPIKAPNPLDPSVKVPVAVDSNLSIDIKGGSLTVSVLPTLAKKPQYSLLLTETITIGTPSDNPTFTIDARGGKGRLGGGLGMTTDLMNYTEFKLGVGPAMGAKVSVGGAMTVKSWKWEWQW